MVSGMTAVTMQHGSGEEYLIIGIMDSGHHGQIFGASIHGGMTSIITETIMI
jgi:hypothetical protein